VRFQNLRRWKPGGVRGSLGHSQSDLEKKRNSWLRPRNRRITWGKGGGQRGCVISTEYERRPDRRREGEVLLIFWNRGKRGRRPESHPGGEGAKQGHLQPFAPAERNCLPLQRNGDGKGVYWSNECANKDVLKGSNWGKLPSCPD